MTFRVFQLFGKARSSLFEPGHFKSRRLPESNGGNQMDLSLAVVVRLPELQI